MRTKSTLPNWQGRHYMQKERRPRPESMLLSSFFIGIFAVYAFARNVVMKNAESAVMTPATQQTSSFFQDASSSSAVAALTQPSSAPPPVVPQASSASQVSPQISSAPPVAVQASSSVVPVISSAPAGRYKDGQYVGMSADAYYGNVQVRVTVEGGKIARVQFLDYPQDRGTSISINSYAMPYLQSEAIQAQDAPVDAVSGATYTSQAFNQSLASALSQARNSA